MERETVTILFSSISILIIFFSVFGLHYSILKDGTHTGTITAMEDTGLIWKTTTVYFKSDAQSSQEDRYCLIDQSLKPQILELQKQKAQVTIRYMQYLIAAQWECSDEDGGIITSIEATKKSVLEPIPNKPTAKLSPNVNPSQILTSIILTLYPNGTGTCGDKVFYFGFGNQTTTRCIHDIFSCEVKCNV